MRVPPGAVTEPELREALRAWGIEAAEPAYAPVGFGDHHWTAQEADGRRWFVMAAAHADKEGGYEGLARAMDTAVALREDGLGFVVAPVRARDGATLRRLAATIRGGGRGLVVTHEEPHPGNVLRGPGGGRSLVDRDTVGLAPAERDLWLVATGPEDLARYRVAAGREVDAGAPAFYRLRWALDDVGLYLGDFRGPHGSTADTEASFAILGDTLTSLS
jgi:Phosphotransferase enzyme family